MRYWIGIACVVVIAASSRLSASENWPQWRGPQGNGVAAAGDYPVKFSPTEGVEWKVDLPGRGTSTPAVWDDRIFVTSPIDGEDGVLCYDMQGKELWRKKLGKERPGKHGNATGSNPSPATDGKNVVVYFKSGTLACFSLDGLEKWKINLQDKYGKDTLWWDLGTSPLIYGDHVIVAVIQAEDAYLVSFDINSGKEVWKTARQYDCPVECDQSYSTPQIVKSDGKDVIVTWGADHLTGHDATDGKLLWECGGFNPKDEGNWRTIASPSVSNGVAIVPHGRGGLLTAVKVGGSGDITKSAPLWSKEGKTTSADIPTPITTDGKAYVLSDAGHITCFDLQTGKEHWSADLPKNRAKFYSSPILAGNKLFCVRQDGTAFVGEVSDEGYKLLAANDMGERMFATPVAIRGKLLLRGDEHLYLIGADGAAAK
ncbi:MAG TPA: PQQ-binding-like beta-propeller repeat protein [Lacipirellulaceae bacterium]|nr:PQQ-binding-like beta-propeller repeat protein [Lacipirellulaceae bacterium]